MQGGSDQLLVAIVILLWILDHPTRGSSPVGVVATVLYLPGGSTILGRALRAVISCWR